MKGLLTRGYLSILLASIACMAVSYKIGTAIFCPAKYLYFIDSRLSAFAQENIICAAQTGKNQSCPSILENIQNQFKAGQKIGITRLPHAIAITIQAARPYMQLGSQNLLLCNGTQIEKKYFKDWAYNQLPFVTLWPHDEQKIFSSAGKEWLLNLDPEFRNQYQIHWADDYEIYATDKNDNQIVLVCSIDTNIDKKKRQMCQHIITQKKAIAQGTANCQYRADMRFEKQIIVCSRKGGAEYG